MTTTPGPLEKPQKRAPRFDFSALDAPTSVQTARKWAADVAQRSVVDLPLDAVIEDPDQPRTKYSEESLQDITNSIRRRRVYQPIIVREKNAEGKHVIIHGSRRYRGSRRAGKTTIPAIIIPNDELDIFDDYSQVIENIQRENLGAEDMCAFIVKRLKLGDKKGEIAENLGIRPQAISAYLALQDAPENVLALFRAGKIDGIQPLYELFRFQAKAPELAARLIASVETNPLGEITLAMIRGAIKEAERGDGGHQPGHQPQTQTSNAAEPRSGEAPPPAASLSTSSPTASAAEARSGEAPSSQAASSGSDEGQTREAGTAANLPTLGQTAEGGRNEDTEPQNPQKAAQQVPYHNPSAHRAAGSGDGRQPDPNFIRKPLLLGQIDGDPVKILLTRRPTSPGLVHISREDTGIEEEVALDRIQLTLLSDMKAQETA